MKPSYIVSMAVMAVLGTTLAVAQTPANPPSTDPSSASTPAQREATRTNEGETPATSGSQPADASSPHQRDAMGKSQTMKQCMDAQAAKNSAMSKSDMKKACDAQMKSHKETAHE